MLSIQIWTTQVMKYQVVGTRSSSTFIGDPGLENKSEMVSASKQTDKITN